MTSSQGCARPLRPSMPTGTGGSFPASSAPRRRVGTAHVAWRASGRSSGRSTSCTAVTWSTPTSWLSCCAARWTFRRQLAARPSGGSTRTETAACLRARSRRQSTASPRTRSSRRPTRTATVQSRTRSSGRCCAPHLSGRTPRPRLEPSCRNWPGWLSLSSCMIVSGALASFADVGPQGCRAVKQWVSRKRNSPASPAMLGGRQRAAAELACVSSCLCRPFIFWRRHRRRRRLSSPQVQGGVFDIVGRLSSACMPQQSCG
mmetsp:Transcript_98687/g.284755  ORF Transcript_98687/g.284755 Transcript_98687/m.284755 type:complete len:260 (+) Transcript_98687:1008-1787(+)